MDVAFSRMTPGCPPFLHGPSRLSRAAGAMPLPPPPLLAEEDVQATLFSEDGTQQQVLLFSENDVQIHAPLFSLDDLQAPLSEDDVQRLAPLFCEEEILALIAVPQPLLNSGTPCSDSHGGKKRKSPPGPSSVEHDEDTEEAKPLPLPPPPPPLAKRARTKSKRGRQDAGAKRRRLRAWHRSIATRVLRRQFRAPEPSRGRTAMRCQCVELALAGDPRGLCALHQDAPADRAWMLTAQGHVPLVGGPGEVLVPTMSAGDSRVAVRQYARWRRSVWMHTRFYVQRAADMGRAGVGR